MQSGGFTRFAGSRSLVAASSLSAVVALGAAGLAAAPAGGATLAAPNVCSLSSSTVGGEPLTGVANTTVEVGGNSAPNPVAAGGKLTLSSLSLSAVLIPKAYFDLPAVQTTIRNARLLGRAQDGVFEFPVEAWLVVAAKNTTAGTALAHGKGVASTTLSTGADGVVHGTDAKVKMALPDISFTAGKTGPIAFGQAGAGALSSLDSAVGLGAAAKAQGSMFVSSELFDGVIKATADCAPGYYDEKTGKTTKVDALPFGVVGVNGSAAGFGDGTTTVSDGSTSVGGRTKRPKILSTSLKAKRGTVSVKVKNPNARAMRIRVSLKTRNRVKIGSKRSFVTLASRSSKPLGAGRTVTYKLKLSKAGKALLRKSKRIRTLTTAAGASSKSNRTLTLKR